MMPHQLSVSEGPDTEMELQVPEESFERCGDPPSPLEDSSTVFRCGFWNAHSFPHEDSLKMQQMVNMLEKHNFHSFGMAELNTNWTMVPHCRRPSEILRKHLRSGTNTMTAFDQHVTTRNKVVCGGVHGRTNR
jgi:hypothetical protein